jgi:hypothetical protein
LKKRDGFTTGHAKNMGVKGLVGHLGSPFQQIALKKYAVRAIAKTKGVVRAY